MAVAGDRFRLITDQKKRTADRQVQRREKKISKNRIANGYTSKPRFTGAALFFR
jgi:hypothetical protein